MKQLIQTVIITLAVIYSTQTAGAQSVTSVRVKLNEDKKALLIPIGFTQNLKWDLPLTIKGGNGSTISWKSSNPSYVDNNGKLLKRAPRAGKAVDVILTANLTLGKETLTKSFKIRIAKEDPPFDAYLFTYFEGTGPKELQEQLRYGISADAINWSALNNNQPIISSELISATGGIRDPHLLRGENINDFFLVATDMFTVKNGWEHNPGIVMMRSSDLITWKHNIIDLEKSYPKKFPNVKWVWAPQTIYDPSVNKYMVYFTVRLKNDPALDFYCAYANKDFTAFEEEPKLMFKAKYGAIDGDIIYKDGLYHFFYKGNTKDENGKEFKNGIQQATAKTLQGPWIEDFKYLDAYAEKHISVEGSGIFKLNNSSDYVLMYDMYRDHRYEFQRSSDLFLFAPPQSFIKNFNPRHGTVINITAKEAQRLGQKWPGLPKELATRQK
ncbi:glycoside hydrolase family 43 protein [Pedobacter riviphilus]|uniref:Glycoside hydrolase family 43 protein n=1 Tax=Pedobacter riviphilus TaxID=2766984 RepID=A0ABX6TBQ1_9SPHI|nr:glycoside hydrolase family 43 protein [Pedobacter riviphilus]QNR82867.1 glycoside hydrolase family 43 protein [Pedobacter riviphilus]